MGVTQGAGLSLQWLRNQLAPDAVQEAKKRGVDPYEILTAEAGEAPPGSEGLFWLPYLMGERTPHFDPQARGGWIGLTASHCRAHLIRSVLEGVSYSLKDCLKTVESLGAEIRLVRASGGGARSPLWRALLAAIFNCPITTLQPQEGSAYGAALLAMVGSGLYTSVVEAYREVVREQDRVEPDPARAEQYERSYRVFRDLCPALKGFFPKMSGEG